MQTVINKNVNLGLVEGATTGLAVHMKSTKILNRPFASCCEPHYESEAKCEVFIIHSYAKKTDFYMKSFALSLTFIMRFTTTIRHAY